SGPRLLLLDEPSSGLDETDRQGLRSILLALRSEKRVGIVCVEHHMDLVRAVATHVIALQAGEVLMTGSPAEVLDSTRFRVAVGGGEGSEQQLTDPDRTGAKPTGEGGGP